MCALKPFALPSHQSEILSASKVFLDLYLNKASYKKAIVPNFKSARMASEEAALDLEIPKSKRGIHVSKKEKKKVKRGTRLGFFQGSASS